MKHSARWQKVLFTKLRVGILFATVAVVTVLFVILHHSSSPLPNAIAKQVAYVTYYPGKQWQTSLQQATYTAGVLRFTSTQNNVSLSFSEQATPPVFTDVPQYYPSLLGKLNQYSSFGSVAGTVYLTKPAELKGGQTAVANTDGTLVFVRPNKDLSTTEWQRLFNNLQTIK